MRARIVVSFGLVVTLVLSSTAASAQIAEPVSVAGTERADLHPVGSDTHYAWMIQRFARQRFSTMSSKRLRQELA
jgi:hypothetical protein